MSLKVFNLQCDQGHTFEGWFASAQAFEQQSKQGLVECPYCASRQVRKLLSAPHVRRSQTLSTKENSSSQALSTQPLPATEQVAQILKSLRRVIGKAEDVGDRFAEEARKMHNGEVKGRSIRGQATAEQCEQLLDEGIDVLPIPPALDPKKQN